MAAGDDYIYINDGFGNTGIKVHTRRSAKPGSNQYAVVTGLSPTEVSGPTARSVIRPREQADQIHY